MLALTRKSAPKFPPLGAALLAALFLFSSAEVRAQHLPIRTYTIADGLAHDQVTASCRTRAASCGSAR